MICIVGRADLERGPGDEPERYFDVMRATLFFIDEFPERLHHPKETQLLFPQLLRLAPQCREVVDRLDRDHAGSERAIRELQHQLLGWELVGESRRLAFEGAARLSGDEPGCSSQRESRQRERYAIPVGQTNDW